MRPGTTLQVSQADFAQFGERFSRCMVAIVSCRRKWLRYQRWMTDERLGAPRPVQPLVRPRIAEAGLVMCPRISLNLSVAGV